MFSMVIPPPNVTGKLHLGHALTVALEDVLCRRMRMKGAKVLWVPGCDHAGIATQAVVERLLQTKNITRHELGRKAFLEEVWKWKDRKEEEIYDQLRILGASLDWSRKSFTMDPTYCRAVQEAFIRLHEKGIVYRKQSLVNWSCQLQSTISDIEIENTTLQGPSSIPVPGYDRKIEFGAIHTFDYPLVNPVSGLETISVSTTRIETMLGDTAIAVHPDDSRYSDLIGCKVKHPLIDGYTLPIIADSKVDQNFSTGAVKITPGHDYNDFEIGSRHNLEIKEILDDGGRICGTGNSKFDGIPRFKARHHVIEALRNLGLYRGKKSHGMTLPICSRSKDVVEPRLKTQWFLQTQELAEKTMEAVKTGKIRILPDSHVAALNNWLMECEDWCISRQLWWGHQIPAYKVTSTAGTTHWISAHSEDEAIKKAVQSGINVCDSSTITQDDDVLDTWFSSALFPFASLGWPDDTHDLRRYYPLSVMETGYDLMFFWVARMVMVGIALTNQIPFKEVYMHTMVRDSQGRKMSKSLGNVIDPLQVIFGSSLEELCNIVKQSNLPKKEETFALKDLSKTLPHGIPECGTDALRFYLCFNKNTGKDISLDVKGVMQQRFFCNKIWNAFKFFERHIKKMKNDLPVDENKLRPVDLWICSRLHATISTVNASLDDYNFSSAAMALHRFFIHEFADVYLESCKPIFNSLEKDDAQMLSVKRNFENVFDVFLRLLSPFMPYLTEELWQRLPNIFRTSESIMTATYPEMELQNSCNLELEKDFETVREIIQIIRQMKQHHGVPASKPATVMIACLDSGIGMYPFIMKNASIIETLAKCQSLSVSKLNLHRLPGSLSQDLSGRNIRIFLKLKGLIDVEQRLALLIERKEGFEMEISQFSMDTLKGNRAKKKAQDKFEKTKQSLEDLNRSIADIQELW